MQRVIFLNGSPFTDSLGINNTSTLNLSHIRQLQVIKLRTPQSSFPLALRTLESIRSPQLSKILLIVNGPPRPCDVCDIFKHWRDALQSCDKFLARLTEAESDDPRRITLLIAMLVQNSFVSNVERIFANFSDMRAGGHHIGLRLYSRSNPDILQGEIWSNDHPPLDLTPGREGWESLIV